MYFLWHNKGHLFVKPLLTGAKQCFSINPIRLNFQCNFLQYYSSWYYSTIVSVLLSLGRRDVFATAPYVKCAALPSASLATQHRLRKKRSSEKGNKRISPIDHTSHSLKATCILTATLTLTPPLTQTTRCGHGAEARVGQLVVVVARWPIALKGQQHTSNTSGHGLRFQSEVDRREGTRRGPVRVRRMQSGPRHLRTCV